MKLKNVYHVGKKKHKHKRSRRNLITIVLLLLVGLMVWWLTNLRVAPEQDIQNSPPSVRPYSAKSPQMLDIETDHFKMQLPAGWTELSYEPSPTAPIYGYKSKENDGQKIEFYIDNTPSGMSINKAVVVEAQADGMIHGRVSDSCTTFTEGSLTNVELGRSAARWEEVGFLCDMKTGRQTIGMISKDGINKLRVSGPTIGEHEVFITYTDNSVAPDYSVLYDILTSIKFK